MEEILDACIALGQSYDFEEEHSRQDARLAARLFDLTADLHHLGEEERDLLVCAALLHDIGYAEGYSRHHKAAHRLIMQAELPGLTEKEKRIVANVARYHRGAQPKRSHDNLAGVEAEDREIISMLGAILRLADGLDRSHTNAVRNLDCWVEGDRFVVWVDCADDCTPEVWAGEKKGRFLGDLLGLEVQVRQRLESTDRQVDQGWGL